MTQHVREIGIAMILPPPGWKEPSRACSGVWPRSAMLERVYRAIARPDESEQSFLHSWFRHDSDIRRIARKSGISRTEADALDRRTTDRLHLLFRTDAPTLPTLLGDADGDRVDEGKEP